MAESNSVSSSSSSVSSSIKFKSVSSSESSENSDEDIRRSRYSRFLNMAPVPQNSDIGAASEVKTKLIKALEVISDHGCEEIVKCWDRIYGFESKNALALKELSDELIGDFEQLMHQKVAKQQKYQAELITRMYAVGEEAGRLGKALGVNSVVDKILKGPLVDMKDRLSFLLPEFRDLKRRNLDTLTELQQKEQELCSILEIKPMPFERKDIISVDDLQEYEQRIKELEGEKDQLEQKFEDYKNELYQLMKECKLRPISKMERYVFGEEHLTISKAELNSLIMTVNQCRHRKANMITEIERHKEQGLSLFQTLRKDRAEIDQFMETVGGYTNSILEKKKAIAENTRAESRYGVPAGCIKRKAPTTSNGPNKTKFMKTVQPSTSRSTISQKSSTTAHWKKAIAENTRAESRYGVPAGCIKRKAPTTSNGPNKTKFMKTVQPSTSRSTISQKSSTRAHWTHKDEKFDEARGGVSLLQTPARAPNTASSSPDSGSSSYESFQVFLSGYKGVVGTGQAAFL